MLLTRKSDITARSASPLVDRLQAACGRRVPRAVAVVLVEVLFVLAVIALHRDLGLREAFPDQILDIARRDHSGSPVFLSKDVCLRGRGRKWGRRLRRVPFRAQHAIEHQVHRAPQHRPPPMPPQPPL